MIGEDRAVQEADNIRTQLPLAEEVPHSFVLWWKISPGWQRVVPPKVLEELCLYSEVEQVVAFLSLRVFLNVLGHSSQSRMVYFLQYLTEPLDLCDWV